MKFEITKQEGNIEVKLEVKVWLIKLLTTVGASSGIPYVLNHVINGKNHSPWQVVSFLPRIIFHKVASATLQAGSMPALYNQEKTDVFYPFVNQHRR
ncbi:hypothetical protein NDK43_20020 [Neobacillus pocheonensis]|uniref:Uncharacterized protein n=1 Tax=Neobacillus pocheonensis TaxID=363869 RepID=A0ABT0WF69_9BACI|nr:hypothetical protein [Neobacillus pocheonensis]